MTAPAEAPPFDQGNPFAVAPYPAFLVTAAIQTAAGPRLLVTVRCGPATLTLLLERDDAKAWGERLTTDAGSVSALLIPQPGPVSLPRLNGGRS